MTNSSYARLPGDPEFTDEMKSMVRVNHAGEFGAQRIYAGQLAVLKGKESEALIRHMADQEQIHYETFDAMMKERRIRPTALMPIWHVAGYALGAASALLGSKSAMACTVAVESVIDAHYAAQQKRIGSQDNELQDAVTKFRAEEREHHDTAIEQGAQAAPLYQPLSAVVKIASKAAIWLSARW
jgi:ubiquinone biosynthesis monooxygenase Coq7